MKGFDKVACTDFAFFQHAGIEAGKFTAPEEFKEVFSPHFDAQFETGVTRLGDLDHRRPNPKSVLDVDAGFEKPFDSEIFAKLSGREVVAGQGFLPVQVVFGGIEVNGFVPAPVDAEVGLPIPIKSEGV